MVGRDVGEHARLVRLVADAAQHDPAAGGLEDGDVDVVARQDLVARPPGPVQSPGSTIRSSTRMPSDVVVPTWRPASSRMWVISRVTVVLPFVPVIETIGIRRSASRIHAGGVVRGAGDRARPAGEQPRPGRRSGGRAGPARRRARRARTPPRRCVRARSAPRHGKVTIQWPGSDERWTRERRRVPRRGRRAAAATQATSAATASRPVARPARRRPSRTSAWRPGIALAVPGPPPADGDLELDHRLEPVDVRALEQADLDESHGPGRIASAHGRRLGVHGRPDRRPAAEPSTGRARRRSRDRDRGATAGVPRRPRAPRQHRLRQLHEGGRRRGRALGRRRSCERLGRDASRSGPIPTAARRHGRRHVPGRRRRAAGPADRPHGHRVRPGDGGRAAVPDRRDGIAHGPGRDRHEGRPARRPVRAPRSSAAPGGLPFERLDFVANPDEEIGSPISTPHHPRARGGRRRVPGARVRPRQRRHRLVPQGHPSTCGSRSHGRAAHAGVEPEKGRSAILEAAAHRPRSTRSTAAGRA